MSSPGGSLELERESGSPPSGPRKIVGAGGERRSSSRAPPSPSDRRGSIGRAARDDDGDIVQGRNRSTRSTPTSRRSSRNERPSLEPDGQPTSIRRAIDELDDIIFGCNPIRGCTDDDDDPRALKGCMSDERYSNGTAVMLMRDKVKETVRCDKPDTASLGDDGSLTSIGDIVVKTSSDTMGGAADDERSDDEETLNTLDDEDKNGLIGLVKDSSIALRDQPMPPGSVSTTTSKRRAAVDDIQPTMMSPNSEQMQMPTRSFFENETPRIGSLTSTYVSDQNNKAHKFAAFPGTPTSTSASKDEPPRARTMDTVGSGGTMSTFSGFNADDMSFASPSVVHVTESKDPELAADEPSVVHVTESKEPEHIADEANNNGLKAAAAAAAAAATATIETAGAANTSSASKIKNEPLIIETVEYDNNETDAPTSTLTDEPAQANTAKKVKSDDSDNKNIKTVQADTVEKESTATEAAVEAKPKETIGDCLDLIIEQVDYEMERTTKDNKEGNNDGNGNVKESDGSTRGTSEKLHNKEKNNDGNGKDKESNGSTRGTSEELSSYFDNLFLANGRSDDPHEDIEVAYEDHKKSLKKENVRRSLCCNWRLWLAAVVTLIIVTGVSAALAQKKRNEAVAAVNSASTTGGVMSQSATLSPFKMQMHLAEGSVMDEETLEEITQTHVSSPMQAAFDNFDKVLLGVTVKEQFRRLGVMANDEAIEASFEGIVFLVDDSILPTQEELDAVVSDAFTGDNFDTYVSSMTKGGIELTSLVVLDEAGANMGSSLGSPFSQPASLQEDDINIKVDKEVDVEDVASTQAEVKEEIMQPTTSPSSFPTHKPSAAPVSTSPTEAPITNEPSSRPTSAPTTEAPSSIPTSALITGAPVSAAPTTASPVSATPTTISPTTVTPTKQPTASPSTKPSTLKPSLHPTSISAAASNFAGDDGNRNGKVKGSKKEKGKGDEEKEEDEEEQEENSVILDSFLGITDDVVGLSTPPPTLATERPSSGSTTSQPTQNPSDMPVAAEKMADDIGAEEEGPVHTDSVLAEESVLETSTTSPPSVSRTSGPTSSPVFTSPTASPTFVASSKPSAIPTTLVPTSIPTSNPSFRPTASPTRTPTVPPSFSPTNVPTQLPTASPSAQPTRTPTVPPSVSPTNVPTQLPTASPSAQPTRTPTVPPSVSPTDVPTQLPTASPSAQPTRTPTVPPSVSPTDVPTQLPTASPSAQPTRTPTVPPSVSPTDVPTQLPIWQDSAPGFLVTGEHAERSTNGMMFDISAKESDITITSIKLHLDSTAADIPVEVFSIQASYVGWELYGRIWRSSKYTISNSLGYGKLTPISDDFKPIKVPAGKTVGIYVLLSEGHQMLVGRGYETTSDDNIRISSGSMVPNSFASVERGVSWSGAIRYTVQ